MIEQAPKLKENSSIIKLMLKIQNNGSLKSIQDAYYYWDKVKYKASEGDSPEDLWSAVKLFRKLKQKRIEFNKTNFYYMSTDFIEKALHQFDMNIGGTLSSNIGIAETDKHKFIISSLIEESIASSQMEGASTTRKKAKEMLRQEKKPKNKSERMILNNFRTMKYIVQHKNDDLTLENLLHIHQLMTEETLDSPEDAGRFREQDNIYVINHVNGEVVHTPPPHLEIHDFIREVCLFFNQDTDDFIHPIVKACIIHFMMAWIHPFTDGNGRTARAVFYWYMLKKGYWLTEYLSISKIIQHTKTQYEKAFIYSEIDQNDLTYFIKYQISAMEKAFQTLKDYINRKQKEVYQAAAFMKIPGVNDRMAQILKLIYDDTDRILTSKEMESRFAISNFTARQDLNALVNLGFLDRIAVNKRKYHFIRSSQFETVLKRYLTH